MTMMMMMMFCLAACLRRWRWFDPSTKRFCCRCCCRWSRAILSPATSSAAHVSFTSEPKEVELRCSSAGVCLQHLRRPAQPMCSRKRATRPRQQRHCLPARRTKRLALLSSSSLEFMSWTTTLSRYVGVVWNFHADSYIAWIKNYFHRININLELHAAILSVSLKL